MSRLARGLLLTEDRRLASLLPTFRTDLANKLLSLTEQSRAVWLSRYQPGGGDNLNTWIILIKTYQLGMNSSLLHLSQLLARLLPPGSSHAPYLDH